jgi:hypothetical protein
MARIGWSHVASAFAAIGLVSIFSAVACSSSTECDATKCAAGNKCLLGYPSADAEQKATGATTSCKLPCSKQEDCPFNYHCTASGGTEPYCVADRPPGGKAYKQGTGQWGTSCDPTKGIEANPACDSAQNFWCYAASPTDGAAFCTQYQCADDGDCKGGWWCATINKAPNATTAARSFGETTTVCLPRVWNGNPNTYCAPCKADVDCPTNNGIKQHCVAIGDGSESVCAAECGTTANCNRDAACADSGSGYNVCIPNAGTCKGKKEFCSPCHSDKDCPDGFCMGPADGEPIATSYSTERFCTKKSSSTCTATSGIIVQGTGCPGAPSGTAGCIASQVGSKPANGQLGDQCVGFWSFGGSNVVGCWSKK